MLLVLGLFFELAGLALDRDWLRRAAGVLLALGVAGAIAAVLSGRDAGERVLGQRVTEDDLRIHEVTAYMAFWYSAGALVLRALAARVSRARRALAAIGLVAWLIGCGFVLIAAERGHHLVLRHGAGVEIQASPHARH